MLIKVKPKVPGARISIARTEPDEHDCVMINQRDLDVAMSHGFEVCAETLPVSGQANETKGTPDAGETTPRRRARI